MKKLTSLFIFSLLLISACSGVETDSKTYPKNHTDTRRDNRGSLASEDGGYNLFGGGKDNEDKGSGIGVNSFLWRATLDTLSFMPIAQADPFGGVITTDWYENPEAKGERFKINAVILDDRLRADGIRVSLFKQTLDPVAGWRDAPSTKEAGKDIENAILTRARQLRVSQTGK